MQNMDSKYAYPNYLKERPSLNERSLRMSVLFTAEKFSERPGLNEPRLCFYNNEIY